MTLEENIKVICEALAKDVAAKFDKDKAMILNNLCEYILPKRQRIGHITEVGESRDFTFNDHEDRTNRSIKATDAEASETAESS